jgi:hypothetical protein
MVEGHTYKDHGINFEDSFFFLNFHISHFLRSVESVSKLKAAIEKSFNVT